MATKPLKTLTFEGLDDTYTIPQIDSTLSVTGGAADAKVTGDAINSLDARVTTIENEEGLHRYGVTGIGQSAASLTRIWDSVGMTAQVGTDGDNSNVINDFDDVAPFNRRKCVGHWKKEDNRAVFVVESYYGDEDYTEDGTKGDYVAVECPKAYYYLKDGRLGVSAHQYDGWKPFDIFCHKHNPNEVMDKVYIPAYALAQKDGHAVSLPNLDNLQGNYKQLLDACRTYNGDASDLAVMYPAAVNFYEWALFTVEFATQNCQSVMYGCGILRHSNDDSATLRSDGKWLLNNYYASRVVGEYVSIQDATIDQNDVSYYASHKITAIVQCDAEGNESSSGAYQLVTTEYLGSERAYEVGTAYRFVARPYRTGACNGVSTPSGSPVSNTNGYYPCKYRWRENPYGNQFKTSVDLFNMRTGTGGSDYYCEWYYLDDPSTYTPSTTSKPDATDLASDAFRLLDCQTDHDNYVNGYIKVLEYSDEYPNIRVPNGTTGGSASTYYCDYASLVDSYVVRAVRFGGIWAYGANDGFSSFYAHYAPSYGTAKAGSDLCFIQ